ncbi:uncharacterized protein TNCV_3096281 [Trichonephila clavipes]|nr:uncharacterized protein TNCV_3096281 [Trichonephila clavipes]
MHGQCPSGSDTWCKYQKAKQEGKLYKHRTAGLPNAILNTVKTTYMDLCDQSLLEKCLHGKTQNANESFNGVLWSIIPKETFVELLTLKFGAFLAVLQFNDGSKGILSVLEYLHIPMGYFILKGFSKVDDERIVDSERHSLPTTKNKRKKLRGLKKRNCALSEKRKVSRINVENFKPVSVLYDLLWFINVNEQNIKKWAFVISLLKEDETDQAIEEPDEIMHINRDSESKYEKSDRHETFELN